MEINGEKSQPDHTWTFFRDGGFDQVLLDSGADLESLGSLDQKLWVALSCPADGVEFDRRTLELMDFDADGQIRAGEIIRAVEFAACRLKSTDLLLRRDDGFPLAEIDGSTVEGARILASARTVLAQLGKADADRLKIEYACATREIFASTPFNGDGIITPASTDEEGLKGWISLLVETLGGTADRSGEVGLDAAMLEKFDSDVTGLLDWLKMAPEIGDHFPTLEGKGAALKLFAEVKGKIGDYFLRCRLALYDGRAAVAMNAAEEQLKAIAVETLSGESAAIEALPLALVDSAAVLDLENGLNPAWQGRIRSFRDRLLTPLLGEKTTMNETEWEMLKGMLAPLEAWWQERAETTVFSIGEEKLAAWAADGACAKLGSLIERDLALKEEFEAIVDLERLARFCRDLYPLANNFVNFRHFYTRSEKAIFQAGRLYLDGRSCDLCVRVKDVAKHATLATLSRLCLVYCECVRNGEAKMTIAAAFTSGDSDQLVIGRNGLFYDRQGRDWDATIVRIIDHPISVRQAILAPYKRVGKMVGEQMQKMAAARSKAAEERAAAAMLSNTKPAAEGAKAPPPQPVDMGRFAGIFAAIGLAAGLIGTAIASAVSGFFKLTWWQMPLVLIAILLIISGPSMLIAWFKLRQRSLGPVLDANGWAINARARLSIPFGGSLTSMARLPKGSRQTMLAKSST